MEEVVVTGIGVVSPLGLGVEENRRRLQKEIHGLTKAAYFDSRYVDTFPFGEVSLPDAELKARLGKGAFKGFTRTCLLAGLAFQEAIQDAELSSDDLAARDTGFVSASTVGGMCYTDQLYADANVLGTASEFALSYSASAHTNHLIKHFKIGGFSATINTACSSSANAIALGYRLIRSGKLQRAIVGGVDSLAKYTVNGFNSLRILSETFCQPFDEKRSGLNLGEGAAYLVLESKSAAKQKKSYGKVAGYGNSNDAYHASAISPEAAGVVKAISRAISQGGVAPDEIDYINTHGTGTINNDETELFGMRQLFPQLPKFSSTKSYTGHTLGAAGAIEAVFSLFSLNYGEIYPNLRLETPISSSNEGLVKKYEEGLSINCVLSNSFGFGGNCTSLLFKRS